MLYRPPEKAVWTSACVAVRQYSPRDLVENNSDAWAFGFRQREFGRLQTQRSAIRHVMAGQIFEVRNFRETLGNRALLPEFLDLNGT